MEYYAVLAFIGVLTLFIGMSTFAFCEGKSVGWKQGFQDAKEIYYTDPEEEKKREEREFLEQLVKENSARPKITPELLMAYGVADVQHLPKDIREFYGVKPGDSIDLDTLIKEEVERSGVQQ